MNIKLKNLNYYLNNADKYLAFALIVLGIIASVVLAFVNTNLLPAPIAIVIFSIVYLVNIQYDVKNSCDAYFSRKYTILLFITIFILINLSFISFIFRPELYSRPLTYFILISIVSGLLTFLIMYLPPNRKYEYLALISIIIIGLSLRILPQVLFPDIVGMDPWVHRNFTIQIMSLGHLVDGFAYSRLPSMHILIAAVSFLTGLNYKWSSVIAVTIPQLISFVVVYLIGRDIFNSKVGLIGALLLCVSANYICLGYWIFPTGFALIFSAFLLYYLIKEDKHDSAADAIIKILLAILIVSIHMQVALAILIFLIFFWVGKRIYNQFQSNGLDFIYSAKVRYTFIILFAVLMFGWWIYMANKVELPFTFIHRALEYDPSQIRDVTAYSTYVIPYYQYLMNISPYLFFYGFSVVGSLYAVSKKSNYNYLALTLGGIALLAMPFLLLQSNMSGYLSERWIYTAQLFMSIPVAIGVFKIFKVTKKKNMFKSIAIISLISIFVFVNVINPSANIDNSHISKYSTIRYAYTDSELISINTLQKMNTNLIYTDKINALAVLTQPITPVDEYLENKNYTLLRGFVILRTVIVSEPVPGMNLNYDPIAELSLNSSFDRVYDSGSERAFLNLINPKAHP
ncbi:MAG: hypothetical protein APG10_01045 [Candidatus Methanofastidiosum methylothiophilum]|uniref:Uncharacterized protein n=1 Tax=Candidatus Methanofastidiosum methylothiophilum TaxID=1705564 RepID=A0A150IK05_9EURY|nr:MAG: hypothetical protein APG10_01045 [Candidatus Methanofastidiosum methylthiophilus]